MALNIGNINFGVDANTTGLQKAIGDISKFQQKTDQVARSQVAANKKVTQSMLEREKILRAALRDTLKFQAAQAKAGVGREQIEQVTTAYKKLVRQLTAGRLSTVQFNRAQQDFRDKMNTSQRALNKFNAAAERGKTGLARYAVLLRDLESSAVLALGPLSGLGARIRSIGAIFGRSHSQVSRFAIFMTAAVAGLTIGFGLLARAAIRAGEEMKGIQLRFEAASGSAATGAKEFQFVIGLSRKLGLEMAGLSKSYSRFLAASQGTSIEGEKSRKIFTSVARAAAALKLSGADVEGVMRAIEQIMSKGTVQAEELRGQLGDRLPGAFRIAAEAMGVTTRELNRMLKAGEVISDEFLPLFAAQLEQDLGKNAEKNLTTLSGQMANLGTNTKLLLTDIDDFLGLSAGAAFAVFKLSEAVGFLAGEQDFLKDATDETNKALEEVPTPERVFNLTKVYEDLLDDMEDVSNELMVNKEALGFLGRAGNDIEFLVDFFTALQDSTAANSDELEKLAERASFLLGTPIEATAEGVAAAFAEWAFQTRETAEQIEKIKDAPDIIKEADDALAELRAELAATLQGPVSEDLFKDVTQPVRDFTESLEDSGESAAKTAARIAEFEANTIALTAAQDANAESVKAQAKALRDAETARKKSVKGIETAEQTLEILGERLRAMSKGPESLEIFEKVEQPLIKFRHALEEAGVKQGVINELTAEYRELLEAQFQLTDKWQRAADQAAQSVVNGLEDIILKGGSVSDMLNQLAKELLRVALRALFLDNLQNALGSFFGGGGFGGLIRPPGGGGGGGGFGGLGSPAAGGGFASGGSFKLPGSGGADDVPFFGMGKAGETVSVGRADQLAGGGGASVVINQTNNFTGPLSDPAQLIPILEENNRKVKGEILDGLDRGAFA